MSSTQRLVVYSIIRLTLFFAITVGLWYLGFPLWVAGILAAIISFALSFLFLRPQRDAIARDLQSRREKPLPDQDGVAEDAAVEDSTQAGRATAEATTVGSDGPEPDASERDASERDGVAQPKREDQ